MSLTLYLIRHADSQVHDEILHDFQRRLTEDGEHNARHMAEKLKEKEVLPDRIFTSPALRARATAEIIAEVLGYPTDDIEDQSRIYEATSRTLNDIINVTNDNYRSVMIIGHNPAISRIVAHLTNEEIENMPPAGVVCMNFELDNWIDISMGSGTYEWYDFPANSIIHNP